MENLPSESLVAETHYDRERRLYDDTTTWFAEMLDGQMRTPFVYTFDGKELYSSDGTALQTIFETSLRVSQTLPPNLAFEFRRRQHEYDEYQDMITMMSSANFNTMVVVSDFPAELMNATKDLGGYNVARKQAMLRVIAKSSNGTLLMQSQSLDGSNRYALEQIYTYLGSDVDPGELLGQRIYLQLHTDHQKGLIDELTAVYDRTLESISGANEGDFYAGRSSQLRQNTYDFVCSQSDLIGLYTESVQTFGDNLPFLHDIAATMQKRFNELQTTCNHEPFHVNNTHYTTLDQLMNEIILAGQESRSAGHIFSGCGLTLGDSVLIDKYKLEFMGYGNQSQRDCEFVSKHCPICKQKNAKTKVVNGTYYHVGKSCRA